MYVYVWLPNESDERVHDPQVESLLKKKNKTDLFLFNYSYVIVINY